MSTTRLVHLSDLHFGVDCDLAQIDALTRDVPAHAADAVVVSGDLSQRARHGEFQAALRFIGQIAGDGPRLVIPGNHDVAWFASPFGIAGTTVLYEKYRRYFGADLAPALELPGAIVAGVHTAHGVAFGSMTPNLNDMAVKGHLPAAEAERVRALFAARAGDRARVVVLHHNVLRGEISGRMGLAHWSDAQRRLAASGADLILCGHDHQEATDLLDGRVVVSTSGTHTSRSRGGRASAYNVIEIGPDTIAVRHRLWNASARAFVDGGRTEFPRRPVAA